MSLTKRQRTSTVVDLLKIVRSGNIEVIPILCDALEEAGRDVTNVRTAWARFIKSPQREWEVREFLLALDRCGITHILPTGFRTYGSVNRPWCEQIAARLHREHRAQSKGG